MSQFESTLAIWNKTVSDFLRGQGVDGANYQDVDGYSIIQVREITDDVFTEIYNIVGKRVDAINESTRQISGVDIEADFALQIDNANIILVLTDNQEATDERVRAYNKMLVFDPVTGTGLDGAIFGIGSSVMETMYQLSCDGFEITG